MHGLTKLDSSGLHQDLQTFQDLTLSNLDAINHVDLRSLSQVPSSSSPSTVDRLDWLSSLLQHSITPMLTQHHAVLSNLSTLMEQDLTSRGGHSCVDPDDGTGSINFLASYSA